MDLPPNLSAALDQDVVAWALKGHEAAHAELYRRYHGPVHTLLYHMVNDHDLAEDLALVTFGKVSRELHTYRSEYKFSAWIFTIANHVGVDHLRKKEPETLSLDDSPLVTSPSGRIRGIQVAAASDSTPHPLRIARHLGPALQQAIERLRPEYRQCVTLRFLENRSYQEIAGITNVPIGTVGVRLQRALQQLREMLGPLPDLSTLDTPRPPT